MAGALYLVPHAAGNFKSKADPEKIADTTDCPKHTIYIYRPSPLSASMAHRFLSVEAEYHIVNGQKSNIRLP